MADDKHHATTTRMRVGRCIYCRSTEPPLTREHIFPQGLAGRDFLIDATCEPCRLITSKVEEYVLRDMLGPIRRGTGLRGKRKPSPMLDAVSMGKNGRPLRERRKHEEIWLKGVFPVFHEPPGILLGFPRERPGRGLTMLTVTDPKVARPGPVAGGAMSFNYPLFARMLAKIAHAQTVRVLGLDGFDPCLTEIILGRDPHWAHFIGCPDEPVGEEPTYGGLIEIRRRPSDGLLVSQLRLVASDAPAYFVVIGRSREAP